MKNAIIVQVPTTDAAELKELAKELGDHRDVELMHPFDGETVAQLFVAVSGSCLPLLQSWLGSRVESRKAATVIYNGTEFRGYTAEEVERLLAAVASKADND